MTTIDFNKVPVEPTIDIIDSEGNIVVTTNSDIVFLYARVQIKHLHLEGWKVRCHNDGYIADIGSDGKVRWWNNGNMPEDEARDERIKYLTKCYEDMYLKGNFPVIYIETKQ